MGRGRTVGGEGGRRDRGKVGGGGGWVGVYLERKRESKEGEGGRRGMRPAGPCHCRRLDDPRSRY